MNRVGNRLPGNDMFEMLDRRGEAAAGPAGQPGFTLIEVLIAMVITAVGMLGLGALGTSAIRMIAAAERDTQAAAIANTYLEDALQRIRHNDIPVSCLDQPLEGGALLTREVVVSTAPREPHRISVTVTPSNGAPAPRAYTITTYVFARTTSGASQNGTC